MKVNVVTELMDMLGKSRKDRIGNAICLTVMVAIAILMAIYSPANLDEDGNYDECGHHRCAIIQVAGATI